MSIQQGGRAFKIEAPEARSYQMMGTLWRVLASGEETDGIVGALDERCAHGICAPTHIHDDADEIFYVVEGNLTFIIGEKRIEAAAGAFVYLPRYVPHGFQCNSAEARVFNFLTPAGFEQLILDGGKPARYDDVPIPNKNPYANQDLPPEMLKKYRMRSVPAGSK